MRIADEFNDICKMPNCIGSIDRKHCRIKCPPNAGSLYFNYKSFHSVNLLGVADANLCFTLIDIGAYGRENDSSVFSNSSFGKAFSSGDLTLSDLNFFLQVKKFFLSNYFVFRCKKTRISNIFLKNTSQGRNSEMIPIGIIGTL